MAPTKRPSPDDARAARKISSAKLPARSTIRHARDSIPFPGMPPPPTSEPESHRKAKAVRRPFLRVPRSKPKPKPSTTTFSEAEEKEFSFFNEPVEKSYTDKAAER
ncbi:hypothetical protein HDK64DRAFT_252731 [Phyllosticta capitalensis]